MKEWTGLGLKMKSDQGWKGTVAMTLQGYGIEYNNRFPKNMYSVFLGSLKHKKYYGFEICFSVLQFLELCRIATSIT